MDGLENEPAGLGRRFRIIARPNVGGIMGSAQSEHADR
jgi:hypothetical protein